MTPSSHRAGVPYRARRCATTLPRAHHGRADAVAGRRPAAAPGLWQIQPAPVAHVDRPAGVPVMLARCSTRSCRSDDRRSQDVLLGSTPPAGPRSWSSTRDLDDDERGALPPAPAAQDCLRRASLRAAARRRRLLELQRAPVLRQPARDPRGARAPRRAARAPLGRQATAGARAADTREASCARAAASTTRRSPARATSSANDHFPDWFERRDGPGVPADLARHAAEADRLRRPRRRAGACGASSAAGTQQVRNWQYVLSPNPFTTPILRRAFALEGEMLEAGYPRNDLLARPGRDERRRAVARRLGIPDGRARRAVRADVARRRVYGRGPLPARPAPRPRAPARGASATTTCCSSASTTTSSTRSRRPRTASCATCRAIPDVTELLLAADVLRHRLLVDDVRLREHRPPDAVLHLRPRRATATSSAASTSTSRPTAPGPLLHTTDDLTDAMRDVDGDHRRVRRSATREFAARFCALDDGLARRGRDQREERASAPSRKQPSTGETSSVERLRDEPEDRALDAATRAASRRRSRRPTCPSSGLAPRATGRTARGEALEAPAAAQRQVAGPAPRRRRAP